MNKTKALKKVTMGHVGCMDAGINYLKEVKKAMKAGDTAEAAGVLGLAQSYLADCLIDLEIEAGIVKPDDLSGEVPKKKRTRKAGREVGVTTDHKDPRGSRKSGDEGGGE